MLYIVKYSCPVPDLSSLATAVRDRKTFSQQFLTPSIIEGIRQKLRCQDSISLYKLDLFVDQCAAEVTGIPEVGKRKLNMKDDGTQPVVSLERGVMIEPTPSFGI
ncbi:MAG: hypothetical protein U5K79_13120 [Cyclobacteriaceae bacterium]|nr:hypothetical protein [Cyclobacteriaceae bacterium]